MYLRFYDLKRNIFQFSTNPEFTWIGDKLERILSQLEGDLVRNPGVYQLIGGIGTGKSTLAGILSKRLPQNVISAEVSDSSLSLMDLLNYLSIAFEIGKQYRSREEFQPDFEKFLDKARAKSQNVLIVIDESQALSPKMPCHLQWLMGFDSKRSPVLSVLLVGQKDLRENGVEEENTLASDILATYTTEPLDLAETTEYIQESLNYAGAEREIFTLDAMQAVYQLSHGVLRNVNILCDNTMIAAHFRKEKEITRARVKASGVDFDLSSDSMVVDEPPSRRAAKKPVRPIFKTAVKTIGATLSLVLVAGGIYVYNSIELIPEMEPATPLVKNKGQDDLLGKEGAARTETVPTVTLQTAENGKPATANDSAAPGVTKLQQDKTKKVVHVTEEPIAVAASSLEGFRKNVDGRLTDSTFPSEGRVIEGSVSDTADQPSSTFRSVPLSKSVMQHDVQPYTSQSDLLLSGGGENMLSETGTANTSTILGGPQSGRDAESAKNSSARSGSSVGPRNVHLVEPRLGIGPGMVSLKSIPTPVQPETVLPPKATGLKGGSGQQMAAKPQPKRTRKPPLENNGDGEVVYSTMARQDIGAGDITAANRTPLASKFQDERMVQPYTPPEEEKAEEIDPGDVIDWLIKKRHKQ